MHSDQDGFDALDPATPAARIFGHYELLKELGRGAQGVVYLAEDTQLHRKVALKMLSTARAQDQDVRERFQREAELASKLEHSGICGVHEFGAVEGIPFIAMQFVAGKPLSDLITDARARSGLSNSGSPPADRDQSGTSLTGKDSMQDILLIVENAARALHEAHEVGLVHRDIKPANIMIAADGHPVILDFGLARDMGDQGHTLTESGQALGTPAYMSGEQILGQRDRIDRRTDIYSLGVTLYECLTLRRPFEAEGFEQLYHQILQGAPVRPRKHNPRIPHDLGTVIEVAMDRDPERRYASALDLAEDLRRVRSFEPIRAKSAGLLTRTHKWVRRKPAPAVTLAAGALFIVSGATMYVQRDLDQRRAFDQSLNETELAVAAEDPTSALEALGRARELRPSAPRVFELTARVDALRVRLDVEQRRSQALESAAGARSESVQRQREYADLRAQLDVLQEELETSRPGIFSDYAVPTARASFANREAEVRHLDVLAEKLLLDAREALERAARLEAPWGVTDQTRVAFASYFLSRWREAVSANDSERALLYQTAVQTYDTEGSHQAELAGFGSLTVTVLPPAATVHLFRYVACDDLREGAVVPRLVPVPTSGIGLAERIDGFDDLAPGDPCFVVESVDSQSLAHRAGLLPGDLIVSINGQPAAEGVFLLDTESRSEASIGEFPARVKSIQGLEVRNLFELPAVLDDESTTTKLILVEGSQALNLNTDALRLASGQQLVEDGASLDDLSIVCCRGTERIELELPAGAVSGLRCFTTANPLFYGALNRIDTSTEVEVEPGSYLLIAMAEGCDVLRLPVQVDRLADVERELRLLPKHSTPPGFVHIPGGKLSLGGDPRARDPLPRHEVEIDDFFMQRFEVTNVEWDEFRNDPEIAARIETSETPIYVPRESSRLIPESNLGGPDTPVMGVSWIDVQGYLAWRNARAEQLGERWTYDLPSEDEWEWAARGADHRAFPWGSRFDYALTTGLHSRAVASFDAPAGIEPRDESPFGVFDLAGLRQEWARTALQLDPGAPPLYRVCGGSWRTTQSQDFRIATRGFAVQTYVGGNIGVRLIARLRTDQ